jgi:predicted nucleotidyltransferase
MGGRLAWAGLSLMRAAAAELGKSVSECVASSPCRVLVADPEWGENDRELRNGMDRESVLAILRHHAPELRAAGLLHLRLFGSVARGQATTLSDVDLLAEFDRSKQMTLVTLAGLESHLSELLGRRVELSSAEWMREPVRERALAEAVLAF